MSIRDRRILSAMTDKAKADVDRLSTQGLDPITGRRPGSKTPCPSCIVKQLDNRHGKAEKAETAETKFPKFPNFPKEGSNE
jgi:hypothetical protein